MVCGGRLLVGLPSGRRPSLQLRPCPAEPEVDRVPRLVDCPIEIGPFSTHLNIGLIDSPRLASGSAKTVPALDELWRKPANPAQDRRMGKIELPLGHHLDQISEAQLVAQVPTHAQDNHLAIKMSTSEQLFDAFRLPIVSPRSLKTTLSDGI